MRQRDVVERRPHRNPSDSRVGCASPTFRVRIGLDSADPSGRHLALAHQTRATAGIAHRLRGKDHSGVGPTRDHRPVGRRARLCYPLPRRGVRVVDGAALEKRCAKAPRVRIPPSPPELIARAGRRSPVGFILSGRGRLVDYGAALEMRFGATRRGFESRPLRQTSGRWLASPRGARTDELGLTTSGRWPRGAQPAPR